MAGRDRVGGKSTEKQQQREARKRNRKKQKDDDVHGQSKRREDIVARASERKGEKERERGGEEGVVGWKSAKRQRGQIPRDSVLSSGAASTRERERGEGRGVGRGRTNQLDACALGCSDGPSGFPWHSP